MWPAFLAALLISLPPAPATARDGGPRSGFDRAHRGEDLPPANSRAAQAAMPEDENEEERDEEA